MAKDVEITPVPDTLMQGEDSNLAFTGITHPSIEAEKQGEVEPPSEPVTEETTPVEEPEVEPQDTPDWAAEKEGILGDLKSERQRRQELERRLEAVEARPVPQQPQGEPQITDEVLAEAMAHEDPQMRTAAIKMMKQQAIEEMKAEQKQQFENHQRFQQEVQKKTQEAMTTYQVKQGDETWQLADHLLRTDPEVQSYNGSPSLYAVALGKAAFMRLKESNDKVKQDVQHTNRMKEANHLERGSRPVGKREPDMRDTIAKAFKTGEWHDVLVESGAFDRPDLED